MNFTSVIGSAKEDPWLLTQLAREGDPAFGITVPEKLSRPSPVLASTIKAMSQARVAGPTNLPPRLSGIHRGVFNLPPTGLRVNPKSADRALLLADTLIKACHRRKIIATVGAARLTFSVGNYRAEVRISEKINERVALGPGRRPETLYEPTRTKVH
jgi:hypothetical protein